jgi:hypothetical protein
VKVSNTRTENLSPGFLRQNRGVPRGSPAGGPARWLFPVFQKARPALQRCCTKLRTLRGKVVDGRPIAMPRRRPVVDLAYYRMTMSNWISSCLGTWHLSCSYYLTPSE